MSSRDRIRSCFFLSFDLDEHAEDSFFFSSRLFDLLEELRYCRSSCQSLLVDVHSSSFLSERHRRSKQRMIFTERFSLQIVYFAVLCFADLQSNWFRLSSLSERKDHPASGERVDGYFVG